MLCNNFEVHYFPFLTVKTKRSVILAGSQNKRKQTIQRLFLALSKDLFRCFCWRQRSHRCFTGQTIS